MQVNRDYLQAKGGFPYRGPSSATALRPAMSGVAWCSALAATPSKPAPAGSMPVRDCQSWIANNGVYRQFIKPLTLIAITQKFSEGSGGAAVGNLRIGRDPGRSILFPVLLALLALFGLASCSDEPKLPKPRFETPVNLSHEGVVADFNIRITKHNIYYFEIRFEYPEEDQAERKRVRRLVGGLHEPTLVPTPVKLMIYKKQAQGEQIVYQKTIADSETSGASSNDFAKTIGHCDLKRGKYRFVLESLAQPQEYASIPTKFVITFPNIFKFSFNSKDIIDRSKSCPQ